MTLTLYMVPGSPPVRAVLMTAKLLGIDLELRQIDLTNGEHKQEYFLKLNPTHTIPVLDDDGFVLWESHAIMPYLCEKFDKNDAALIYPKDIKKRAIVHQRLHFDSGILFARLLAALRPVIYEGKKSIDQDKLDAVDEAYGFLEKFLENTRFVAGDSITIADFSLFASVGASNIVLPIEFAKYPKLDAWLKKAETLKTTGDIYKNGITVLSHVLKNLLAK